MEFQWLGYVACALLVLTYWTKQPVDLRRLAIAANVALLVYGALTHLVILAVVNAVVLPINVLRLMELLTLQRKVQHALESDLSLDWLRPMMQRRHVKAGEYLFRQGDPGDQLYYIVSGRVRLVEIDVMLTAGQLIGEMAVFTPAAARTLSAVCEEQVELMSMPTGELLKLYYRDPDFGVYLIRLIARRFLHNVDALQGLAAERAADIKRLKTLAKLDEATGLGDHDGIEARLRAEWARATRIPAPLSLLVAKASFDANSVELRGIAEALRRCVSRASDFIGRDGRDFVVIMPHTDDPAVLVVAEKMREALEALGLSGTFAFGTATRVPARDGNPLSLLLDARAAATLQTA